MVSGTAQICGRVFGLLPFGFSALDTFRVTVGGFVLGVLGDEPPGEGFFQDGLAQGVGAGEGGVDLGLERVGGFEPGVEAADDFGLFGGGAEFKCKELPCNWFSPLLIEPEQVLVCLPPASKSVGP